MTSVDLDAEACPFDTDLTSERTTLLPDGAMRSETNRANVNVMVELGIAFLAAAVTYGLPIATNSFFSPGLTAALAVAITVMSTVGALSISLASFTMYWVLLALLQNFLSGVWLADNELYLPIYVTEAKTIAIAVAMTVSAQAIFAYFRAAPKLRFWAYSYVAIILVSTRGVEGATLPYLRNFLVPILVIVMYAALTDTWARKEKLILINRVVVTATWLLSVGVIAELLTQTETWRTWLRADANGALNSLSDTTTLFGVPLARVGGVIIEPTNAGYVSAAIVLVCVVTYVESRKENLGGLTGLGPAIPAMACLFASGAKSGFLMLAIALIGLAVFSASNRYAVGFAVSWALSFVVVFAYVVSVKGLSKTFGMFSDPFSNLGTDSTTFHLAGLIVGIKSIFENPLGAGIGVGGNFSRNPAESWQVWIGTGSESSWGVLSYQAGALGILLFLGAIISIASHLGKASAILLCGWTSAAMFAEALFGPQVAGFVAIAAGVLSHSLGDKSRPQIVDNHIGRGALK